MESYNDDIVTAVFKIRLIDMQAGGLFSTGFLRTSINYLSFRKNDLPFFAQRYKDR
jgi:hypothetical protein